MSSGAGGLSTVDWLDGSYQRHHTTSPLPHHHHHHHHHGRHHRRQQQQQQHWPSSSFSRDVSVSSPNQPTTGNTPV